MDYAALAKQFGGQIVSPSDEPKTDYAELARQFGGAITPKVGASPVDLKQASADALEGTNPLQRALINLGAGADSTWQGVKQLFGQGPSADEVKQKRARDQALADNTTGGAVAQFVGELAPTLAVPGGMFVKALTKAPRLGTAAAALDGAIAGGLTGAASMAESGDERLFNSVAGIVGGVALPGLIAGGRTIRDILTRGGAEAKAAEQLVQAAGGPEAAEQVLAKLRQQRTGVAKDVPLTAAEVTQNPGLARAERTAAARHTEDWAPFRAEQAQARYAALQKATQGADNVGSLREARDAATGGMRTAALEAAEPNDFTSPVSAAAAWLKEGSGGGNSAATAIADYVSSKLGPKTTPEQLYSIRKELTDKLNGKAQLGNELSAATKQARRETMTMVQAIDDALDGASGGKWSPYLEKYKSKSGEVNSAEALDFIRKSYAKDSAPQFAGVPSVTGHNLGRAIERTKGQYGDRLSGDARRGLQELQDNIGASEGLQKLLKMTGTSGGGSNTAMDLTGLAADAAGDKITSVVPVLGRLLERSDKMTQAAMSDALRNPDVFIAGVTRRLARSQPLTRTEESVLALLRSVGSVGSVELAEPQR